jgi:hypothetical protein
MLRLRLLKVGAYPLKVMLIDLVKEYPGKELGKYQNVANVVMSGEN